MKPSYPASLVHLCQPKVTAGSGVYLVSSLTALWVLVQVVAFYYALWGQRIYTIDLQNFLAALVLILLCWCVNLPGSESHATLCSFAYIQTSFLKVHKKGLKQSLKLKFYFANSDRGCFQEKKIKFHTNSQTLNISPTRRRGPMLERYIIWV